MLECGYCNYYSNINGKKSCEFSGHLFVKSPENMDKYPCKDISYDSYLRRKEKLKDISIVA
jgi:hypothetical protein